MRSAIDKQVGIILTIASDHPIRPDYFQQTNDKSIIPIYSNWADKVFRNLTQSLRNVRQTKRGENWTGYQLQICASCFGDAIKLGKSIKY